MLGCQALYSAIVWGTPIVWGHLKIPVPGCVCLQTCTCDPSSSLTCECAAVDRAAWHAKRPIIRAALCPYCGSTPLLLTTSCSNTTNLIAHRYRTTTENTQPLQGQKHCDKGMEKSEFHRSIQVPYCEKIKGLYVDMLANIKFRMWWEYILIKYKKSFYCGIADMVPVWKTCVLNIYSSTCSDEWFQLHK